mgnify:CR=1 FL=1
MRPLSKEGMVTTRFPHILAAIQELGATHAERARALGVSETRYYQILSGDVPEATLRRWLQHPSIVAAALRDLGLAPADPSAELAASHKEAPHVR